MCSHDYFFPLDMDDHDNYVSDQQHVPTQVLLTRLTFFK